MYYVFEKSGDSFSDEYIFTDKGYLYDKIPFDQLVLISFHFTDLSIHYLFDPEKFSVQFHEDDGFIDFLKEKNVDHIKYEFTDSINDDLKTFHLKDGRAVELNYEWITTGYAYSFNEIGHEDPIGHFRVPKSGKIHLKPTDSPIKISFKHQGEGTDENIKKSLKGQSQSKAIGCVVGGVFVIIVIIAFFYFGKFLNWIGIGG